MEKTTITENFSDSYKELKNDLKEKYARILCNAIDDARDKAVEKTNSAIKPELLNLLGQTENLKKQKSKKEKEFFKSEQYQTAQKNLKEIKSKLDKASDEEKSKIEKEFNKALSEVTTLNITIKNRLKDLDEKINLNSQVLQNELSGSGSDIAKIKNEVMGFLQLKIAECVKGYNVELSELNKTFGVEIPKKPELPFEGDIIKLDVPVFSFDFDGRKKSVDSGSEEKRTLIYSKNESNVIN